MSKLSANQIVSALLEYGINPAAPAPGSAEDPWRQHIGPLQPLKFAPRPETSLDQPVGALTGPEEDPHFNDPLSPPFANEVPEPEELEGTVPITHKPLLPKNKYLNRFKWQPNDPDGPADPIPGAEEPTPPKNKYLNRFKWQPPAESEPPALGPA